MGLFSDKKKYLKNNYVKVVDVLEALYQISEDGWSEVAQFIQQSNIDSIQTYHNFGANNLELAACQMVTIPHAYDYDYNEGSLKQALLAFLGNNGAYLDGEEGLENKIIVGCRFTNEFKNYLWLKSDVCNFEDFKKLNLIEIVESHRPIKKNIQKNRIYDDVNQAEKKYRELIFCIENFSERFNTPIAGLAKFLKQKKFDLHHDAYIRVGSQDFIKLNKIDSERSLSFVFDFLDDLKFNKMELGLEDNFFHLNHILIDEDDLLYFSPLKDMFVDIRIGHDLYENLKYGDIKINKLDMISEYFRQKNKEYFDTYWKEVSSVESKEAPKIEPQLNKFDIHPSLNPNNSNHAPELLLAVQAWEAKYLNGEYTHHEHSPAITKFLEKKGITNTRLKARISAITNPKK